MTGREQTLLRLFLRSADCGIIADTLEVVNCLRYLKDYVRKRLGRGRTVEAKAQGIAGLFAWIDLASD